MSQSSVLATNPHPPRVSFGHIPWEILGQLMNLLAYPRMFHFWNYTLPNYHDFNLGKKKM